MRRPVAPQKLLKSNYGTNYEISIRHLALHVTEGARARREISSLGVAERREVSGVGGRSSGEELHLKYAVQIL